MKLKRSTPIRIALVGMMMSACLAFCGCVSAEVQDATSSINAIGEVTIESYPAISEAKGKYDALSDEDKQKVENHEKLNEAESRFAELAYMEIKKELEKADELSSSYYAQYFDAGDFESARERALAAIEGSDEESYASVYEELSEANAALESFVSRETEKSYSVPTEISADYPFMLEESDLPEKWHFQPLVMQTSSHPNLVTSSKEALDLPTYIHLFVGGGSRNYTYEVSQVPTVEITVQDENGEMQTALVNTQVQFTVDSDLVAKGPNEELNERPAYFLVNKDSCILLALRDYDGKDHYVLYASQG